MTAARDMHEILMYVLYVKSRVSVRIMILITKYSRGKYMYVHIKKALQIKNDQNNLISYC